MSQPDTLPEFDSFAPAEVKKVEAHPEIKTKKKRSKVMQWLAFGAASLTMSLGLSPTDKRGEKIETLPDASPAHSLFVPEYFPGNDFPIEDSARPEVERKDQTLENVPKHRPINKPAREPHSRPVDYFAPASTGAIDTVLRVDSSTESFTYEVITPEDYTPAEREVLVDGKWKEKIDSIIDAISMPQALKDYYKSGESFQLVYGDDADAYLATARSGSEGTTLLTTVEGKPGKYLIVISSKLKKDGENTMVLRDTLIEERVQGVLYDLFRRQFLSDPERFADMGIHSVDELTNEMTSGNIRAYLEWMQHVLIQAQMPGWIGNSYTLFWKDLSFGSLKHTQSLNEVSKKIISFMNEKAVAIDTPGKAATFLAGTTGFTWIYNISRQENHPFWNNFGISRDSRLLIPPNQQSLLMK